MKSILHILAAGVAMAVATSPAAASVKIATYKGIISDGTDVTGVFGIVGQDLTGLRYTTTFTYDRNRGDIRVTDGSTYDASFSDGYFGSPMISATIAINNVVRRIGGSLDGSAYTNKAVGFVQHTIHDYVYRDGDVGTESEIINFGRTVDAAASLEDNVNAINVSSDHHSRGMTISDFTSNGGYAFASAHFSADAIYSVSGATGGVPEPANWAMLIAGFSLTGTAMRRRRAVPAVV